MINLNVKEAVKVLVFAENYFEEGTFNGYRTLLSIPEEYKEKWSVRELKAFLVAAAEYTLNNGEFEEISNESSESFYFLGKHLSKVKDNIVDLNAWFYHLKHERDYPIPFAVFDSAEELENFLNKALDDIYYKIKEENSRE